MLFVAVHSDHYWAVRILLAQQLPLYTFWARGCLFGFVSEPHISLRSFHGPCRFFMCRIDNIDFGTKPDVSTLLSCFQEISGVPTSLQKPHSQQRGSGSSVSTASTADKSVSSSASMRVDLASSSATTRVDESSAMNNYENFPKRANMGGKSGWRSVTHGSMVCTTGSDLQLVSWASASLKVHCFQRQKQYSSGGIVQQMDVTIHFSDARTISVLPPG